MQGSRTPQALAECAQGCAALTIDPESVPGLVAMECQEFVALAEGGGGASPGGATPAVAGNAAALAGVWIAEESSLTPGIYMRFTQYVTLWPDGTVSYSKSEGGASRTAIDESWERFRSWREGATPARVVGQWSSDGASIRVQWSVWNNLLSQGRVHSANELTLSGMGALEEGATLTFTRSR